MNYVLLSDCCIVFQNRVASVPIDGCWVLSQFACSISDVAVDIHFHVLCKLCDVPPLVAVTEKWNSWVLRYIFLFC